MAVVSVTANPGTLVDDSSVGTQTWTNVGYATSDDANRATNAFATGTQTTHYIKATNFGFAIPSGAIIRGIKVIPNGHSSNIWFGMYIRLVKGGTIQSTELGSYLSTPAVYFGDPPAGYPDGNNQSYGGSTYLWGTTWTRNDINSASFGVALYIKHENLSQTPGIDETLYTGEARIDNLAVTIYYDDPTPAPMINLIGGVTPEGEYRLHIGNVYFEDQSTSNVELCYNIADSRIKSTNIWYPDYGKDVNNRCLWTDANGKTNMYIGSALTQTTFKDDYEYSDNGSDIAMTWYSKDFPIQDYNSDRHLQNIWVEYKGNMTSTIDIIISARVDCGDWIQQTSLTLPISSSPVSYFRIRGLKATKGRTLGFKIYSTESVSTSIYRFIAKYSTNRTNNKPTIE
jgi:hypothetical protein